MQEGIRKRIEEKLAGIVGDLKEKKIITTPEVAKAFGKVQRHRFIPNLYLPEGEELKKYEVDAEAPEELLIDEIYKDTPLVIDAEGEKVISTSSQPAVMAMMIEKAGVKPDSAILEIGTGSGYNAAVLSEITGSPARVTTMEVLPKVARRAEDALGCAGYGEVNIIKKDGGFGYTDNAPYDSVLVTCSAATVTPHWMKQLDVGGAICLPLATRGIETLIALEKESDTTIKGKPSIYVRFIRFDSLTTSLSHDYILSSERTSLTRLLKRHGKENGELTEKICSEDRKAKMDYEFFVAVNDPRAICFYDTDVEGSPLRGFGLRDKDFKDGGVVLLYPDRAVAYGSEKLRVRLRELYDQWEGMGKPGLEDYEMEFHLDDVYVSPKEGEWLIERAGVNQIVRIKK